MCSNSSIDHQDSILDVAHWLKLDFNVRVLDPGCVICLWSSRSVATFICDFPLLFSIWLCHRIQPVLVFYQGVGWGGGDLFECCRFLGCLDPWRVVERCGRILKEEQMCLAVPLRGRNDNGMYHCHASGKCIVKYL